MISLSFVMAKNNNNDAVWRFSIFICSLVMHLLITLRFHQAIYFSQLQSIWGLNSFKQRNILFPSRYTLFAMICVAKWIKIILKWSVNISGNKRNKMNKYTNNNEAAAAAATTSQHQAIHTFTFALAFAFAFAFNESVSIFPCTCSMFSNFFALQIIPLWVKFILLLT